MNLDKAKYMALSLINIHLDGWSFGFDGAVRRMGCCHYSKRKITLSRRLVELTDEAKVRDTILHEIAHALTKGHGHDRVWRAKAMELGACGQRCYTTDEDAPLRVVPVKGKYTLVCPHCKREHYYYRKKKRESACGICCKKYNRGMYSDKYLLIPKEEKDRAIYNNRFLSSRPSMAQMIANDQAKRDVINNEKN